MIFVAWVDGNLLSLGALAGMKQKNDLLVQVANSYHV